MNAANKHILKREARILNEAQFMIRGKHTLRTTAKFFGVGKSTVHTDVTEKLKHINMDMYIKVQEVIEYNKRQRTKRCGLAMKKRKESRDNVK